MAFRRNLGLRSEETSTQLRHGDCKTLAIRLKPHRPCPDPRWPRWCWGWCRCRSCARYPWEPRPLRPQYRCCCSFRLVGSRRSERLALSRARGAVIEVVVRIGDPVGHVEPHLHGIRMQRNVRCGPMVELGFIKYWIHVMRGAAPPKNKKSRCQTFDSPLSP